MWFGFRGSAWCGSVQRGTVRFGMAGQGKGFMVRRGGAEHCSVGYGVVWVSRRDMAR
jgi:hypothetical protein